MRRCDLLKILVENGCPLNHLNTASNIISRYSNNKPRRTSLEETLQHQDLHDLIKFGILQIDTNQYLVPTVQVKSQLNIK